MIRLTVVGNLGRDAEVKQLASGDSVTEMSLACEVRQGGEKVTEWVRVSIWGKRGTSLAPYLTKGQRIVATGACQVHRYTTQGGESRAELRMRADEIAFAGGPKQERQQQPAAPASGRAPWEDPPKGADFGNDDIPF